MFGISDLGTFIIGTTLIVLLPGPNSLYVMSVASRFGIRTGYAAAFGVFTGDLILIVCTILGAASLLHAFPWLFTLLKVIGALYLGYLGIKLLIAAYKTWFPQPKTLHTHLSTTATSNTTERVHPYRTALMISVINPKAILFYLSFFVQFVNPDYAYPMLSFAVLAIVLQIISMGYLSILIFSGVKLASYFNQRYKIAAICVASIGILFCGFGFRLASSTL
ncbi:MAG: leucine efflux protein LeuE [Acinetobacter sp.]|uniref:leucine efflux protein LeuE n=1 Tax=Acinetobacter sp. TaxID=472 RepID=UPI0026E0B025|nr:leucine efflux protein LeuE [Acinetobacter sp.]MDO5542694.1 leucine efflux protein LeuE [Acinetobacter sp.]